MNIGMIAAYTAGGLLMVLGAVELVRWLCFRLHNRSHGEGQGGMALVVMPKSAEDCEALLRAAGERLEWMALKPPCRMVCLDPGSQEAREIALRLSLRYRELEFCRPEELVMRLAGPAEAMGMEKQEE